MTEGERRLAAIMFTDMVGYTALTQKSESLAMELLEEQRSLVRPFIQRYNGREIKTVGDAFLIEFASALEAVRCGFEIQRTLHEANSKKPADKRVELRIGVHLGDVLHRQEDVYGDAVNVASRVEPLAPSGGMCVTEEVYSQVKNKFEAPMTSMGRKELKNVEEPVKVFKVDMPWEQNVTTEQLDHPLNRIAILPFASFSPDPNDTYFADGITDEIISTVAGISGLSVISRTSVMGYKGTTKRVREIGRELGVGSILEGSFKKAGNRIRVTTQLIDVADDKHLWAQNYDRSLDDVFEVQTDVAKQVADALRIKILAPELKRIDRKPTASTTAYSHYLKGRYLWNKRGIEDLRRAREEFEEAIVDDPGFALGYVGVADCCALLRNNWELDRDSNLEKAKTMVAKALELDPTLAEAHTTRGMVLQSDYKLLEAEEEYRKAIGLKPSYATAHQWYFGVLLDLLRWDEALEQIEKAHELDPLSPIINDNYGDYYFAKRDLPKALEFYKRAVDLGMVSAHVYMATVYGMQKRFDEMRQEVAMSSKEVLQAFPYAERADEAYFAWLEGDRDKLKMLLPEVEIHQKESGWNNFFLSVMYFSLGEKDRGFELLEKSYSEKEGALASIQYLWFFDEIRTDPRYGVILSKIGLA